MRRRLQSRGAPFEFSKENKKHLKEVLKKYPQGKERSAVMEALHTAQRQDGWISHEVVEVVAEMLSLSPIHVYEVATFYTMFFLEPKGRHHLQVCTTTPCWLRGSEGVLKACQKAAKTNPDLFSFEEVECLGACANAPILQINNDFYYEDLDEALTEKLLTQLKEGKTPHAGSAIGRQASAQEGGAHVLKTLQTEVSGKEDADASR